MSIKNLLPRVFGKPDAPVRHVDDDPFVSLQRNMNRLFEDFFQDMGTTSFDTAFGSFTPSVDVQETDKEIKVQAELPGLDENNINISLANNRLSISGEKKQESESNTGNFYRLERSYGSFRRDIALPCEVEEDKVDARFKNGVLTVTLPRTEADKPRKIAVKVA